MELNTFIINSPSTIRFVLGNSEFWSHVCKLYNIANNANVTNPYEIGDWHCNHILIRILKELDPNVADYLSTIYDEYSNSEIPYIRDTYVDLNEYSLKLFF